MACCMAARLEALVALGDGRIVPNSVKRFHTAAPGTSSSSSSSCSIRSSLRQPPPGAFPRQALFVGKPSISGGGDKAWGPHPGYRASRRPHSMPGGARRCRASAVAATSLQQVVQSEAGTLSKPQGRLITDPGVGAGVEEVNAGQTPEVNPGQSMEVDVRSMAREVEEQLAALVARSGGGAESSRCQVASLQRGTWSKLICGASFEDLVDVRNLSLVYTLAGVDCIDCAADSAVVAAVHEGIDAALSEHARWQQGVLRRPWVMVSINDDEDPHFRKAAFDAARCPPDCPRPCEAVCPAGAISFAAPPSPSLPPLPLPLPLPSLPPPFPSPSLPSSPPPPPPPPSPCFPPAPAPAPAPSASSAPSAPYPSQSRLPTLDVASRTPATPASPAPAAPAPAAAAAGERRAGGTGSPAALTGGVLQDRCYGCGRCLPVCPLGLIDAHMYVRDHQATSALLASGKVDAIEIHTRPGHLAAFGDVWRHLGRAMQRLKLVAVSVPDLGPDMPGVMAAMHAAIMPAPAGAILWQLDGRPMSGDIGAGATRAAVLLAQRILATPGVPPGFIQLAGGTNGHTVPMLRRMGLAPPAPPPSAAASSSPSSPTSASPLGAHVADARQPTSAVPIAGVAYGGYARKIVKHILKQLQDEASSSTAALAPAAMAMAMGQAGRGSPAGTCHLEKHPHLLLDALEQAVGLLGPLKGY